MGSLISSLISAMVFKRHAKILMLGLDAAGKTTILHKLKLGKVIDTVPTIGLTVETVKYKNVEFIVWDAGGQAQIRLLWKHYYQRTQGLIFVVDSCDKERIELARDELQGLMKEEELRDAAVLIFANKQDIGVMSVAEVSEKMGLHTINGRDWHIQGTSAMTGEGLYNGLEWLTKTINKKE